jgi:ubiquinone/menaquinone biosynthesis C-methylase UbiE
MEVKKMFSSKEIDGAKTTLWGTHEWFSYLTDSDESSPASYFAHGKNGYQLFRHEALAHFLRKKLMDEELNSIVDVGCGSGHLLDSIRLTFDVNSARGIDFIEPVLQIARNNFPEIDFVLSALPQLPINNHSVDMVIVSEVLYYLSEEDRVMALNEIYRSLRPGGYVFFTSTLGEKYFTAFSAKTLIESKFEIKNLEFLHSKLYHFINFLPYRIVRFTELLQSNKVPSSDKNRLLYERFRPWLSNKFSRLVLRLLSKLFITFLANSYIPKICEWLARYMGKMFRGNILILAQKRGES